MRHTLHTGVDLVEFYPSPHSVVYKHPLKIRDVVHPSPAFLPCLEGLVALQHDKHIDTASVAAMTVNMRFDASGNAITICPNFFRFLCTTYMTAKLKRYTRCLPSGVYTGSLKTFSEKTAFYPALCKKIIVNTMNTCKARTHALYGKKDIHPDSKFVLGTSVCTGCYNQLFDPDGWINIESCALEPAAYKSIIRPLRMAGIRYFLLGIVVANMQRRSCSSKEEFKQLGRAYLANPLGFFSRHYTDNDNFKFLALMTSPIVWRLSVILRTAKYVPDPTLIVHLDYFGWALTDKRLNRSIFGKLIRQPFVEPLQQSLYQTIVLNRTTNIIMHNDMYAWWASDHTVTAILVEKGFELVGAIDARSWSAAPVSDPVTVCHAEHITWTQLKGLGNRIVLLYGNLESAVLGVEHGGGVFAELVTSETIPVEKGEWTSTSTSLPQHPCWTKHCSMRQLLSSVGT